MDLIYKKIEEKDKEQLFKLIDVVLKGLPDQAHFIPYEQWELDSMFDEVNYAPLYGAYDGEKTCWYGTTIYFTRYVSRF